MHRRWKRVKYPYNPNKPKILRFGPDDQPHAKACRCNPCKAYLLIIERLNPSRIDELGQVTNAQVKL